MPPRGSKAEKPGRPDAAAGTTVLESAISSIVDDVLRYRGYSVEQLAGHVPFEEVAWLLWTGEPADAGARATMREGFAAGARIGIASRAGSDQFPEDSSPVSRMLISLPQLPLVEGLVLHESTLLTTSAASFTRRASLLLGAFTVLAAAAQGAHAFGPQARAAIDGLARGDGVAAAFLALTRELSGRSPPSDAEVRALDTVLTLYADHELNASTFAGRVAASTRADLVACVVAALCALSGPLHGGVDRAVRAMLAAAAEEGVEAVLDRYLLAGQLLPGFGHSVYRRGDPRATLMRGLAERLAPAAGQQALLELTLTLAREAQRRGVPPANVDLFMVVVCRSLGIPDRLSPLVFALGRLAGWSAHVQEQYQRNRLIRPRAAYVGPPPRDWPER